MMMSPETGKASAFPDLIGRILEGRGIHGLDEQLRFLNPSLKDLRDPFLLNDMQKAVDRLLLARQRGETVAIYADFDLDGTSGAALLKRGMGWMGFQDLIVYQPKRLSEGYGLHPEAIEVLSDQGVNVVVSVDVGITAHAAAHMCISRKIDLIITDHHLPKATLPEAFAIVNPNSGRCSSGLGHLSGAGVAFYLVLALRKSLRINGESFDFDPKDLLDCFVIGTLTDMTPLILENRALVRHGLARLHLTSRPGLKKLIEKTTGLRALTSADVGFSIAPKLNALSRLELGMTPLEVLLLEDENQADELITAVLSQNESRRDLQTYALEKARFDLEEKNEARLASGEEPLSALWVWARDFHKGVIGLVASQLARDFHQPAFVGSQTEDGFITGSARLPDGCRLNLAELLSDCSETLMQSGGHAQAAGFKLKAENAEAFGNLLQQKVSARAAAATAPLSVFDSVAAWAELSELTPHFQKWYLQLEPFGRDFPTPLLGFRHLTVVRIQELRGGHLKWVVSSNGNDEMECLFFRAEEAHRKILPGATIQLAAEVSFNHFAGRTRLQLIGRQVRPDF